MVGGEAKFQSSLDEDCSDADSSVLDIQNHEASAEACGDNRPLTPPTVMDQRLEKLTTQMQELVVQGQKTQSYLDSELSKMRAQLDIAMGRCRNVLVLNARENFSKGEKERIQYENQLILSIFGSAKLPPTTEWKRSHGIGK